MTANRPITNLEPLLAPSTERKRTEWNLQINVCATYLRSTWHMMRVLFIVLYPDLNEALVTPWQLCLDNMATSGGCFSRFRCLSFSELVRGSTTYSHDVIPICQEQSHDTWLYQKSSNGRRYCWQIHCVTPRPKWGVLRKGCWSKRCINFTGRTFKPVSLSPTTNIFVFSGISELPSLTVFHPQQSHGDIRPRLSSAGGLYESNAGSACKQCEAIQL